MNLADYPTIEDRQAALLKVIRDSEVEFDYKTLCKKDPDGDPLFDRWYFVYSQGKVSDKQELQIEATTVSRDGMKGKMLQDASKEINIKVENVDFQKMKSRYLLVVAGKTKCLADLNTGQDLIVKMDMKGGLDTHVELSVKALDTLSQLIGELRKLAIKVESKDASMAPEELKQLSVEVEAAIVKCADSKKAFITYAANCKTLLG